MKKSERKEFLYMIMNMAHDCERGGISWETFVANLDIALGIMKQPEETCKKCGGAGFAE